MENHSSLEQNLNVLSRLRVDLKRTKDQVAIRGKWDMVAWLKNVRDREWQVDEIVKRFDARKIGLFLNDLDTIDVLNRKMVESLMAVKILIEEGNVGLESIPEHLSSLEKYQLKLFSYEDLKKFTNFNKKLGSGGYSDVYQGDFEGEQVAVKVLNENDMVYETFLSERSTMGRISHTNLVKLYGYCFDDDKKTLVYEYMENGSLDKILYKNPDSVEWEKLYGIALEIARGLAYLHHDCSEQIIHHDVKAANVLLDKNLCPKITDFGVSNIMRSDLTHLTNTRIRGTNYYFAPEINQPSFPITCKCDVYSFGIMMFEILGRRCSISKDKIWFPHEVSLMLNKQPETIMEYCGIMEKDRKKAMIVLMVAMWCAQYTPAKRPSMSHVVEVLEKEMSVTTPPYPFQHYNALGHSMVPSLQGTPVVHRNVPVNDKRLANSYPTPVAEGDLLINAYRDEENKKELEGYLNDLETSGFSESCLKSYSSKDIEELTSGFSEYNIIGVGGFGIVYMCTFPDGVKVAIKVLRNDDIVEEVFLNEVLRMRGLYHKNILRMHGFCFDGKMNAVMHEYMPWGSLDTILYQNHHGIEWGRLYGIVIDIARGLSYLHKGHTHPIIHFDVKPSNILLDKNLSPKIRSFGLAKSMASDVSHFILTRTRGTPGYAAPEMWMPSSQVTSKADVYSFGIMMFEVLGRRSNNRPGERWFPLQVWEKIETGEIEELVEACGITRENREDAEVLSKIALWCVQYTPDKRPSMETVLNMLEKERLVRPPPNPFLLN